ncbi:MAG: type II toxin-antitoxin system HicB family antitoxin [Deltaproteobacteria bacterium]|jgi:predicted HicB family RNase H-like nuclease|nr:type II toxin-antitoxin system HicB family antitoxin [Deltaproteobacteria bacterium]
MNAMTYKGYTATIEYSSEDGCLVGHILGIKDLLGFHGDSVTEMKSAFEETVNDYLETCAKVGREPNKPYSGNLSLRIGPELHAKLAIQAKVKGKSINALVTDTLSRLTEAGA